MLTVVFATLVLMFAGGVIAYLGDTWGYKLGKKRLTLFGLRPRVTANLLTVVFGVLIALLTFGVLISVNAGFRVALLRGASLLHNNHQLKRQNQALIAQNADRAAKNIALQQQADQYREQAAAEAETERKTGTKLNQTTKELTARQKQLQTVNKTLQVAQAQLASAQTQVAALEARQQRLIALSRTIEAQNHLRANAYLIFTTRAEVGRTVISAGQSQKAIRADLINFLNDLSSQAKMLGAAPAGNHRYVEIASFRLGNTRTFIDENDSIAALADQIHSQGKGSVVVIARAAGNAFQKKPVYVRLQPYDNRLVIPAGAILGETVIPAQQKGVSEILADMEAFLKGPVHLAALHRGVIPVLPQDYIGGAYPREIDPAVQQIQQIKGDAVLVALSRKDTYAGDQVSVDFTVRPAAGQAIAAQGAQP